MQEMVYEDVFSRTFGYIRHNGVGLNRDSALAAVRLIEELLVADAPDVMDRVIVELPHRLDRAGDRAVFALPPLSPPLNRGSIAYRNT
jgi:hypothetical protein